MLLASLAMMILPLPGWLLDALFTFNIVLAVLVLLLELLVALSQLVALVVLLQMELLVSLVAMAVSREAEQWATLVADEAADQTKALLASLQLGPQTDQPEGRLLVLQADHRQVLRHCHQSQSP